MKLAWLVRVFDSDGDETFYSTLPRFYYSARRIAYLEVEDD